MMHKGGYITEWDQDAYVVPVCSCGWKGNGCSDEDVALDLWTDHMTSADVQGTVTE